MAWVTTCPKCGRARVFNHKAGTCYECTPADGVPKNRERKENASANAVVLLAECNRLTAERDRIAAERDELQEEVKRIDWKREENKAFAILYRKDLEDARAELARVKAESLRVVVDGEAYSMDDVDIWRCVDNMLGLYMYEKELLLCDDGTGLAAPVRLERWEDE